MINNYIKSLLSKRKRGLVNRNFNPQMLISDKLHKELCENGFFYIKNAIPKDAISKLHKLYDEIRSRETYENTEHFYNTVAFQDLEIRKTVVNRSLEILYPHLSKIINVKKAEFPLGGSFCINPSNASRGCGPHQDPTFVDEESTYSIMLWIPMVNVQVENGCMHVIKKSHLWGNFHRSISVKWAFDEYIEQIWEYAIPLPMEIGDIIGFDFSTIHCSRPNMTDETRLAVNVPIVPKNEKIRNYFPKKGILKYNHAEMFHIDGKYYTEESQLERPSSRFEFKKIVKLDNYYTEKQMKYLLEKASD